MQDTRQGFRNRGRLELKARAVPQPGALGLRGRVPVRLMFLAAKCCPGPPEGATAMTTTSPEAGPATATPLTFAANPGGRFPSVLTEDDGRVTAPAGGAPMRV